MDIQIRAMLKCDWNDVSRIYFEGIQTGTATFQTTVPTWEAWDQGHIKTCRLVAIQEDGTVVGWVALSPISARPAYCGVAEVSIYIDEKCRGKGIGKKLLERLVQTSERLGFWTLQAGIFADNVGSIALHKTIGFREVGRRERIGQTEKGVWKDTLLMERRSETVGTIAIRKYEKCDWNQICDIFSRAKPDELSPSVPKELILKLEEDEGLLKSFNESVLYVAELEGNIVGFAGYSDHLISFLFVDPSYYRKGIGRALLKRILAELDQSAWLRVAKLNENAKRLYQEFGFQVGDAFTGKYNDIAIEVEIMALCPELKSWK